MESYWLRTNLKYMCVDKDTNDLSLVSEFPGLMLPEHLDLILMPGLLRSGLKV